MKYVSFDTTSSGTSDTVPTTAHQKELGRYLADELARLGLENAHMDQLGYVYTFCPRHRVGHVPALGLISHMDTSPAVSGADIQPEIVTYQGGDLPLAKTGCLRVKDFPFLSRYVGQQLIVTDGTTLLGADDKAGVAEIVTACEYLLAHPEIPHRTVAVCFTPDEEVGKGTDHFDPAKFPAKAAYTVDGGELGEIEYENFNAAAVTLTVHGVNIHPGSAKDKMKNAVLMAHQFISLLPEARPPPTPRATRASTTSPTSPATRRRWCSTPSSVTTTVRSSRPARLSWKTPSATSTAFGARFLPAGAEGQLL